MKNKTGNAVIIIILAVIILCGLISWRQNERNGGSEEQGYAQEQNVDSSGDETSDGTSSEPYSIETSEDSEEYQDTKQESITVEESEAEGLSEEEQIRAWYDEWFNIDHPLWESNEREYRQKSLTYQLAEPCHFILSTNLYCALEVYEYRNIDDETLYNDYGERILMQEAYLADIVLDKYIREYGGKEGQYSIRDTSADLGDPWETGLFVVYTFEISNEDTTLRVLWSLYDYLVCVYIEDSELEEITELEKMTYLYWEEVYGSDISSEEEDAYWMLIAPNAPAESCHYRNVDLDYAEKRNVRCNEWEYYIADQVIDRYIRDYGGEDAIYSISPVEDKERQSDNNSGVAQIQAECGEVKLLIQYTKEEWLISVEIEDEDLDIGWASDEEIEKAGERKNLKRLKMVVDVYSNLMPLSNLVNLEELSMTVNTSGKTKDLYYVGQMTHLKKLYLFSNDSGTYLNTLFLDNLTEMESLEVMRFKIKDLSFLKDMRKLRYLVVTFVDDANLEYLENADLLDNFFYIQGHNIRNVESLTGARNIRSIILVEMETNPDQLESINLEAFSQMEELNSLVLVRTQIDDLTPIANLPNLEKLVLSNTGIEDIQCLSTLTNLKEIWLCGENSEELYEQAQELFPQIQINVTDDEYPYISY
ncbi:MAG: leucine-rich repeat domain-containing protein [Lachnospiraceae bacterium]